MNSPPKSAAFPPEKKPKSCLEEGCKNPVKAYGRCISHYMKMRRKGEVPARVALYPSYVAFTHGQLRTLTNTARVQGMPMAALLRDIVQNWIDGTQVEVQPAKTGAAP